MKTLHPAISVLTIVVGLNILYLITDIPWIIYLAVCLGIAGIFFPAFSRLLHFLWFTLAELMGVVVSKILLIVIFYLLLAPLAMLSKLFRKKRQFSLNKDKSTNFVYRLNAEDIEMGFKNPW